MVLSSTGLLDHCRNNVDTKMHLILRRYKINKVDYSHSSGIVLVFTTAMMDMHMDRHIWLPADCLMEVMINSVDYHEDP